MSPRDAMAHHSNTRLPAIQRPLDPSALPSSEAPTVALVPATQLEIEQCWLLNGQVWSGRLPLSSYLRREQYLASQSQTANGRITYWILTDLELATSEAVITQNRGRPILASCETLQKLAFVRRAGKDAEKGVEDVISHGVGSVFCRPQYRGRGYAGRMMLELAKTLATWDTGREIAETSTERTAFTVLYSDIGKDFYARRGWKAMKSTHVALPPVTASNDGAEKILAAKVLRADDLASLCDEDARLLRRSLQETGISSEGSLVAFVPSKDIMQWHHAREEFFAREMLQKNPEIKGAFIQGPDENTRVWCIWTRMFGSEADGCGDVLHILRLVVVNETGSKESLNVGPAAYAGQTQPTKEVASDFEGIETLIAVVLREAQQEAGRWKIPKVELWNPNEDTVKAVAYLLAEEGKEVEVVVREEESIASLMWYGDDNVRLEWIGNEKYSWC
ncbi:hypothetical protein MMC25_005613 [Agyrium rufum]|nr:hypothetical protein [Agyrium rufum]